ncbi:cell division protein FtsA [Kurthia massiliensis]|uniref:cell division protein FtsA n=1 Tax=Kurthia massiliensis TaxID=1033739 RepID=UPI000288658A|nr:cell division protein FtsA [Kurthia massiliensis]
MKKIFALDIGTRSVVGVILEKTGNDYNVLDLLIEEHKERAMVDGQIHNVLHVAEVIQHIKSQLEEKHGPLTHVSVAAAGRSLKTETGEMTLDIKKRASMTDDDIHRLELAAVQHAQEKLVNHQDGKHASHYYCVGYSVLHYYIDDQEIGSLIDQQGETVKIEVIATFLPRVVVESLIASLKRADLSLDGLTLEPIAAINALIPNTMRRLNVALVDIGAGTSDIAITDNSTVVAYGMVPTAGDEITEALSDQYLLDFPVAETMKRQLLLNDTVTIADILGFEQDVPCADVIEQIKPAIHHLAQSIADEVLRLNNAQSPKAVLLVGGGSLTPLLETELAERLQLPANRVAVRGIDAIPSLVKDPARTKSPELVTPIGIAIAAEHSPIKYVTVTVNGQMIRLFELKEMTVSDALLAANVQAKKLYGKPGLGLSVTVNGQHIMIPGEHGSPTEILVNGQPTSMKEAIQDGDTIELREGQNGAPGHALLNELIELAPPIDITVFDEQYTLAPVITVNGVECTQLDYAVQDGDDIRCTPLSTIEDVLHTLHQKAALEQVKPFKLAVDHKVVELPSLSSELLLNGMHAKLNYPVQSGDVIAIKPQTNPTVEFVAKHLHMQLENTIQVTFQGETIQLSKLAVDVLVNRKPATPQTILQLNDTVQFIALDQSGWQYQDVFRFSDWQLPTDFKGTFNILRNGEAVGFDAPIFGGDTLTIELLPAQ